MAFDPTRRALFGFLIATAMVFSVPSSLASDDDDDGGSGNNGSGNSGSGGNDDGDDDDDRDDEDNENHDDDGDKQNRGNSEARKASEVVKARKAVPLRTLMEHLRKNYPGRVLDVDLKRSLLRYTYDVKVLRSSGKVERLRLDALTLQKR